MSKQIRVLQVFGEPLSNGGQESFIMNMYRNINREKVQFDFYTPYYCDNSRLKNEIENLGGRVFTSNGKFLEQGSKKDFKKNIKTFLKDKKYDIIHIHSGSIYSLMIAAKYARKSGAKSVIVHSHCGGFYNLKYRIIKALSVPYFLKYPTHYFACSKLAAEWKFPKSVIKKQKYIILNNAVDTSKLYYSVDIRKKTRKELNIDNNFVVGHIGRFSIQKNHEFLIDIFKEILKIRNDAILLLIGTGELQGKIKNKVIKLGIEKNVMFLGIRKDINELLNAMDVFVLPSFFEGLPVVGVEAQATGLPVYASTNITKELPIKELINYYSLSEPAENWAKEIINDYNKMSDRKSTTDKMVLAGFEVKNAAKKMEDIYLEINNMER